MSLIILNVDWLAVVVGAVVAFLLGWLWYSDKLFGLKWREGARSVTGMEYPMALPMIAQVVSTFLFAWVIGVAEAMGSTWLALLFIITTAGLIKANGLFAGKSMYAIRTEAGYVFVMGIIVILAHMVL